MPRRDQTEPRSQKDEELIEQITLVGNGVALFLCALIDYAKGRVEKPAVVVASAELIERAVVLADLTE